jgi:hypothetical protein
MRDISSDWMESAEEGTANPSATKALARISQLLNLDSGVLLQVKRREAHNKVQTWIAGNLCMMEVNTFFNRYSRNIIFVRNC